MLISKKTKKPKGVQVAISQKAHAILFRKAFESKPRKTIRSIINITLGLPEDQ